MPRTINVLSGAEVGADVERVGVTIRAWPEIWLLCRGWTGGLESSRKEQPGEQCDVKARAGPSIVYKH